MFGPCNKTVMSAHIAIPSLLLTATDDRANDTAQRPAEAHYGISSALIRRVCQVFDGSLRDSYSAVESPLQESGSDHACDRFGCSVKDQSCRVSKQGREKDKSTAEL
jgi:hypothetical protein